MDAWLPVLEQGAIAEGLVPLTRLDKCPFPWFGGKSDAAPAVWAALGDCEHYVEPFAGSLAVLLRRPHTCNRTYFSETCNDLDGLLCNAWRSIQRSPDATADAASWPVCEADVHARHLALLRWRAERQLEHLMGDPDWHDPKMAGWWAWGQSSWIGGGWCSGRGGWVVGADGRIEKRGDGGGVKRQRPHISNAGGGVNHPQAREPGVDRQRPHISNAGGGVNHPQAREPGVDRQLPHLTDDGRGVNTAAVRELGIESEHEYHPMTMPELRRWFAFLSARLRHVRILNGDWQRACTTGALKSLSVRKGGGHCGVFLDPPYGDVRDHDLYAEDGLDLAAAVRGWCVEHGAEPWLRVVLAGFAGEHEELAEHGWRAVEWYRKGFLKGGMAQMGTGGSQQQSERLWLSPHCLDSTAGQMGMGW